MSYYDQKAKQIEAYLKEELGLFYTNLHAAGRETPKMFGRVNEDIGSKLEELSRKTIDVEDFKIRITSLKSEKVGAGTLPSDYDVIVHNRYNFHAQIMGNGPVTCEILYMEPKNECVPKLL